MPKTPSTTPDTQSPKPQAASSTQAPAPRIISAQVFSDFAAL